MIPSLSVLALAGVAAAAWEPHQVMHHALKAPTFQFKRDLQDRDTDPCKILGKAYRASGAKLGDAPIVDVKPSVGIACLKSVPLDKERNLALLEYLGPYVQFQSTLEVLADPPETYLFPGVDVLGGLEAIKKKLQNDEYETQYGFMTDLRSIFAASNDGHFDYPPALLNIIQFVRRDLDFLSLSRDGTHTPEVFMTLDVARANHGTLTYHPSAVSSIDGIPINQWLENDAVLNVANYQDPDAQFNGLFTTVQRNAGGGSGTSTYSSWEIPDSYTIRFRNGSKSVVENGIIFYPTGDWSKVESGEDVHKTFEIPSSSSKDDSSSDKLRRRSSSNETTAPAGFPEAIEQHKLGSLAGYFLDGDYKDTAVLSILSFLPVGLSDEELANLDYTDYILEARRVIVKFFKKAQEEGRDKLIVDVSANGGGSVYLANEIYRLIFPQGDFSAYDRFRANEALGVASEIDYDSLVNVLVTQSKYYPVGTDGESIRSGKEWYGPYVAGGQNVTDAYQDDKRVAWDPTVPVYFNGENEKYTVIFKPVFKPENIIVLTDGTCASACGILTGLLTRGHNVRTVTIGGRPLRLAMQAMGGVRGSRLAYNGDVLTATAQFYASIKHNKTAVKQIEDVADVFPSTEDAPLLPLISGTSGGRVNSLSAYPDDDLTGYPLQFHYEAANCRLFYTQRMTKDVTEQWRHVYSVGWKGGKCVSGSTTNDDDTIGDETVKYSSRVRSHAVPLANPGSLSKH